MKSFGTGTIGISLGDDIDNTLNGQLDDYGQPKDQITPSFGNQNQNMFATDQKLRLPALEGGFASVRELDNESNYSSWESRSSLYVSDVKKPANYLKPVLCRRSFTDKK